MNNTDFKKSSMFFLLILALIGGLVYLPLIGSMGYYKDDWYLIYDAHTQGARFFHEVYRIDRPARAYVMEFAYNLFGNQVIYYHLSGYLFRVLASLSLFWTLNMIWPGSRKPNFLIALLLLIYPGFLSQPNPIDYQSQLLSLCLAFVSIAFTVKALTVHTLASRLACSVLAIVTGLIYPALVEYMIGLEVLRLMFVAQIVIQEQNSGWKERALKIVIRWLPFLSAPLLFLLWRFFLFESERRATDLGSQFGMLFNSPLTGVWWLVSWIQDAFRIIVLAWTVPFHNLVLGLRLREFLVGSGIGLLVLLLTAAAMVEWRKRAPLELEEQTDAGWKTSILVMGIATALIALLPVIIVNRHADFGDYSRYSLASAVGAAMVLVIFVLSIRHRYFRLIFTGLVIFMSSVTHYANAAAYAREAENVRNFWWQVAWRVPNIQPGTTLVASYAAGGIQEDYFIWGPANLIYYPEKQATIPIKITLPAAVLTDEVVRQILINKGEETPLRRGNELTRDLSNVLVMAQAAENSCIRLIDGANPNLSIGDPQHIMLIAPKSKLENVISEGEQPIPPESIFGSEPEHTWCFYFQQADLARQRGDWTQVASLGEEAEKMGLHPNDSIEWMPFLQAHAYLDNQKQVKGLSTRINTQLFYREQACAILTAMPANGSPLSAEMTDLTNELFCK